MNWHDPDSKVLAMSQKVHPNTMERNSIPYMKKRTHKEVER